MSAGCPGALAARRNALRLQFRKLTKNTVGDHDSRSPVFLPFERRHSHFRFGAANQFTATDGISQLP